MNHDGRAQRAASAPPGRPATAPGLRDGRHGPGSPAPSAALLRYLARKAMR